MAQWVLVKKKEYEDQLKKLVLVKGKWKTVKPKIGYVANAVRTYYHSLKNAKWDDPDFRAAVSVASRAVKELEKNGNVDDVEEPSNGKRLRAEGGGRKKQVSNNHIWIRAF